MKACKVKVDSRSKDGYEYDVDTIRDDLIKTKLIEKAFITDHLKKKNLTFRDVDETP